MSSIVRYKQHKRSIIKQHAKSQNRKGWTQVLTTLLPLTALWWLSAHAANEVWLTALLILPMSLFLLRAFVLMHDCGHDSLFRTSFLNKAFGFAFGVILGIPQYVWAKHHAYHHATNGNWAKYRGPLATASIDEYAALTGTQQRRYGFMRSTWLAPMGGFLYLIFQPRLTWLMGTLDLVRHKLGRNRRADFETRRWASAKEHMSMLWSNIVLLGLWLIMSRAMGVESFFIVYLISLSLAGGAGIVLFTVQHNFEHAYATGDDGWDSDVAAIQGTSFLILPRWLNWFTADVAYHHVHHLSPRIPNYRLAGCHKEYEGLFADVTRVKLSQIPSALKYILWDTHLRRIISIAEYERKIIRLA